MTINPPSKLRVMVDANILVAGSGWPRFAYEVLQHAYQADFDLVLTPRIIFEARRAAKAVIPERAPSLDRFLQEVHYEPADTPTDEDIQEHSALVRDFKDVHVALAAMNAAVDFLITQDRDLTEHYEANQPLHEKVKVILPAAFLRQQMGWTSEAVEAIRHRTWQDLADE